MTSPAKSSSIPSGQSAAKPSFSDLMAARGAGKTTRASVSKPPPPPPKNARRKRKVYEVYDSAETLTLESALSTVLIPDHVEIMEAEENLDAAMAALWTAFQNMRSNQLKVEWIIGENNSKVCIATRRARELSAELETMKGRIASLQADLKNKDKKIAKLETELKSAKEESGTVAMDLGTYFGKQARLEIMDEFTAGKHVDWDPEALRLELEKEYPDGCPHSEFLEKLGLINPTYE